MILEKKTFGLNNYHKVTLLSYPVFFPDEDYFMWDETVDKMETALYSTVTGLSYSTADKYLKDVKSSRKDQKDLVLEDVKSYCNHLLNDINLKIEAIDSSTKLTHQLCTNAIIRLNASYEAAIFLAYEGFNFETTAICRLILENLNFIFQVGSVENHHAKNIAEFCKEFKIKNTNISRLKSFFSYMNIGLLYGILTNYAHFDYSVQSSMFHSDSENGKSFIAFKSVKYSYSNFYIIAVLLELNQIIIEYAFRDIVDEFTFLDNSNNNHVKQEMRKFRYPKKEELFKNGQEAK